MSNFRVSSVLVETLAPETDICGISDIVDRTCIKRDDVIATLSHLNVLYYVKGQHVIYLSRDLIQAHQKAMQRRNLRVDAKLLNWKSRDWSKRGRW
ncbi:unnamed protein product [Schistosoma curassoni]|uniref:Histone acetyltransferase n=1 Tax=Schistosoma curassoni TaxID=6186 RepID=A0A183KGC8_9TREM|nr:unnamed protein product [Schistosoma curassoni]